MEGTKCEYRYREGVHGEHCIDFGYLGWIREATIGRAATKQDADNIVQALNRAIAQMPNT